MTHTIELSPAAEAVLQAKAARLGVSLEELIRHVAEREANGETNGATHAPKEPPRPSQAEIEARLQAIHKFTETARELNVAAAQPVRTWTREEIYEGYIEHILGIPEESPRCLT